MRMNPSVTFLFRSLITRIADLVACRLAEPWNYGINQSKFYAAPPGGQLWMEINRSQRKEE